MTRYACPCCGFLTYLSPPNGSFDICPVCYWEDDAVQSGDPSFAGGANRVSLNEAKRNFAKYGASEERFQGRTRSPGEAEVPARGNE